MAKKKWRVSSDRWWFDEFLARPGRWFGGTFWIGVFVVLFAVPTLQVILLLRGELSAGVGWIVAIFDMFVVYALFTLTSALSYFGTRFFSNRVMVMGFFRRVGLIEKYNLYIHATTYRNMKKKSQKDSVLDELVHEPYSFRIFYRYVLRTSVAVLAIPIYLGLSVFSLRIIPEDHFPEGHASGFEVLSLLQVFRDLQTSFLGGSSTEHRPHFRSIEGGEGGSDGNIGIVEGNDDSLVENLADGYSFISPSWSEVLWEILGIFVAGIYALVVLILFPVQITILGDLERFFRCRDFWKEHLLHLADMNSFVDHAAK